ncbi:hypothetical protein [Streptomyces fagopyri]|uniref:hypothetical protein n=1 Tax=Streptomyces fagopyri TaxID=2662397 RepID=UPI003723FB30
MDYLVHYLRRLDRNENTTSWICPHLHLASVHEEALVEMAVTAQVVDARVSRRIDTCSDASRSRPAPRGPSPSPRPDGTLPEDFAEEGGQASDTGVPRRSGAGLSNVGQVRPWLTGRDGIDNCAKVHKDAISHLSAYMLVLVPQPIRPSLRLEIEATVLVMRSTAQQHA